MPLLYDSVICYTAVSYQCGTSLLRTKALTSNEADCRGRSIYPPAGKENNCTTRKFAHGLRPHTEFATDLFDNNNNHTIIIIILPPLIIIITIKII